MDGGYAWVVVFGSFLGHLAVLGVQYSFGVTFEALVEDFKASPANVAWVGSLTIGFQLGMGVLSGWLIARWGERFVICQGGILAGAALLLASFAEHLWQLYLTYGVLFGLSCSWIWPPCILVVQRWFSKKRSFASAVASSGSGVGTMVLGPGVSALINGLGWRTTFRILAGCIVAVAAIIAFLFRAPRIAGPTLQRGVSSCYFRALEGGRLPLLRNIPLLTLMLSAMIAGLGWFVLPVHIVQHATDLGVADGKRPMLVSCIGVGLTVGRVPICWLADQWGRRIRAFALVTAGIGVAHFLSAAAQSFEALIPACILYGMFAGAYVALTPPVVKEFMAIEELPQAAGLVYTAWGWAVMLGPPTAGMLYSRSSSPSYVLPFCTAGTLLLVGASLALVLEFLVARQATQKEASGIVGPQVREDTPVSQSEAQIRI